MNQWCQCIQETLHRGWLENPTCFFELKYGLLWFKLPFTAICSHLCPNLMIITHFHIWLNAYHTQTKTDFIFVNKIMWLYASKPSQTCHVEDGSWLLRKPVWCCGLWMCVNLADMLSMRVQSCYQLVLFALICFPCLCGLENIFIYITYLCVCSRGRYGEIVWKK